jgi:hypothetical protein
MSPIQFQESLSLWTLIRNRVTLVSPTQTNNYFYRNILFVKKI